MSFLVIAVAGGLSVEETDRALELGPQHIAAGDGYRSLLEAASFDGIDIVDVTEEYLLTKAAWIQGQDAESVELEHLFGVDEFIQKQSREREALAAIGDGLMRRYLISAVRP